MGDSPVSIQAISRSEPSTLSWFGEVVLLAEYLRKHGILTKLSEGIRFARKRFGCYDVIDFLAVLFVRLRRTFRTHPGGVLRAAPAICCPIHGLV